MPNTLLTSREITLEMLESLKRNMRFGTMGVIVNPGQAVSIRPFIPQLEEGESNDWEQYDGDWDTEV